MFTMIQNVETDNSLIPGTYTIGQVPNYERDANVSGGSDDDKSPPLDQISSRVLLTISARSEGNIFQFETPKFRELEDLDPDEYIDPYCVISVCDAATMYPIREWAEIGRTEIITNTQVYYKNDIRYK